ncbi:DNA polymerase II large subunit [Candidatus Woesearchaeota archaeon]|nr:MAG: DNA polymerase II large subunit [Candidatus Woesearchaeota archaeon]
MADEFPESSPEMKQYFRFISDEVERAYSVASKARKLGFDPEDRVDVRLAKNMAERVEGLISDVAPQLIGSGMTKRIQELEAKYGSLAWEVAFIIAEEVAKEKFCKFSSKKEAMEVGIRTGFAYCTVGIVSAPLEGFVELVIKKRRDGKEYLALKFAGPVRGAGGTASAQAVIIADYVRLKMGYAPYDPDENELNRFVTELYDYHERVTNLQYKPSEKEIKFLAANIPVEIDGDPTEKFEVSNYKDLPRVDTNRIRSGVCLVLSMYALKAPKLWKRMRKLGPLFGMDYSFLEEFLRIQKEVKAAAEASSSKTASSEKIKPNYTYVADLVAGRPVLTHPMRAGGFRLRYGRSRVSGFSAASIHPVTTVLLDKFIATGTQLKVERPGKAASITLCDSIEPPIVKLSDGSVVKVKTLEEAKKFSKDVVEILFLGDILFNYGDFSENGHMLVPAGYCPEWWVQELEKAAVSLFGSLDVEKIAELVGCPPETIDRILRNFLFENVPSSLAISLSQKLDIPLHPEYTYFWSTISLEQLSVLSSWISKGRTESGSGRIEKLILPLEDAPKRVLELLGVPHVVAGNEFVVVERNHSSALLVSLGVLSPSDLSSLPQRLSSLLSSESTSSSESEISNSDTLSIINKLSPIKIRDKAGTFIGARMGRPEKAKMRKLTGSPHVLFPVGEEGGRLRSFNAAIETKKVTADFSVFFCSSCKKETVYSVCESCGKRTKPLYFCSQCGTLEKPCSHNPVRYKNMSIDLNHYFESAIKKLSLKVYPDLIKGVRGTSNKDHIPEHLVKGILRAMHDIYVNKDGTTRYDMTELPMTHFKPSEIGTSVEKLRELGYTHDVKGVPLSSPDQVLELKPQDVVLPASPESLEEGADKVLMRVAAFVDDLLVNLYGLKPYYNIKSREDLVGHLVIGLAPHISAGMIGRIIGFSETMGCFAHPLWHASLRRDCDGDENCVILLMDALLNFSRQYLPDSRGGRTMDAPLVLTSILTPAEVDDMVFGLDVVSKYYLDFYDAASGYKMPWDVKIEQLADRLHTPKQYEGISFTHPVSSINIGVKCSAYKTLPSMEEKLKGQMALADKIRAVDAVDVARLVIEKHFLKDTKGNLRKFSQQQFRCVKCNTKFRRPPLKGVCTNCGGKIIFTVSEGSVVKYLEPSISLAEKYDLPPYLKQTLEMLKMRVEEVFGKESEKQTGLGSWF